MLGRNLLIKEAAQMKRLENHVALATGDLGQIA